LSEMKIEKSRLFVFEWMIFSWCWTAVQRVYGIKNREGIIKKTKKEI